MSLDLQRKRGNCPLLGRSVSLANSVELIHLQVVQRLIYAGCGPVNAHLLNGGGISQPDLLPQGVIAEAAAGAHCLVYVPVSVWRGDGCADLCTKCDSVRFYTR